ncbi:hypothetical protein GCM10022225_13370 [Plantactinospora mayteni]|uniref:Uncharacterized protein n=1 Tax=Plantactinospora mayteni TaxID=566021 RepID=A0ABQ4EGQ3_9ACTN|nr:hypothetical protein Pma05_04830 [Plantactinospora mayteni]
MGRASDAGSNTWIPPFRRPGSDRGPPFGDCWGAGDTDASAGAVPWIVRYGAGGTTDAAVTLFAAGSMGRYGGAVPVATPTRGGITPLGTERGPL